MKKKDNIKPDISGANNIDALVSNIQITNNYFFRSIQKQVNTALTLRNYFIGCILSEYELKGGDRAVYGENLFREIARRTNHIKGMSERNLYLFRSFYLAYPNILQTLSAKSYFKNLKGTEILQTPSAKSKITDKHTGNTVVDLDKLINHLSFSHIIELLKTEDGRRRKFYETETIKNNWSVRELQRAMNSMVYERTGLSKNKKAVMLKQNNAHEVIPENVFKNPYILEFLNIEEKVTYSETDLEQAILNHLQNFLLELGKGFCFEARQKRITFDNRHYHVDLVFYHRILKCHVLVDLKVGEFEHADVGQMNLYLNYFTENETVVGDNPPIGIILCAYKNANLVRYATTGMSQKIFVNKYLINLPQEEQLKEIIEEEQNKVITKTKNINRKKQYNINLPQG